MWPWNHVDIIRRGMKVNRPDADCEIGNLALGLLSFGRAIPHGDCPSVGLAGHSLHGGFGYTSRMWGLSTDSIVGLDVVTSDGMRRYASAQQNAELFWVSVLEILAATVIWMLTTASRR